MKIKQTTKMIILVVALVAVVGVGAVSFAAWNGGAPSITASASTGAVELVGFTATEISELAGKTFVPFDQKSAAGNTEGAIPLGTVDFVSFAVPAFVANQDWKIVIKVSENAPTFKMSYGAQITEAPADVSAGWTVITTEGVEVVAKTLAESTVDAATGAVSGLQYINIVLDSSSFADMSIENITFTLTVQAQ